MEYITSTLGNLIDQTAFMNLTWGNLIMIGVACLFLYLAIRRGFEPLLLVPIAFGMLLVNIYPDIMISPEDASNETGGLLYYFYKLDEWSVFPSLIFLGVGAMTDFGPLIANPKSFLLGAAAQFGIFAAYLGAMVMGFSDKAAAAISIIGGADGPTSIFLAGDCCGGILVYVAGADYPAADYETAYHKRGESHKNGAASSGIQTGTNPISYYHYSSCMSYSSDYGASGRYAYAWKSVPGMWCGKAAD